MIGYPFANPTLMNLPITGFPFPSNAGYNPLVSACNAACAVPFAASQSTPITSPFLTPGLQTYPHFNPALYPQAGLPFGYGDFFAPQFQALPFAYPGVNPGYSPIAQGPFGFTPFVQNPFIPQSFGPFGRTIPFAQNMFSPFSAFSPQGWMSGIPSSVATVAPAVPVLH